MWFPRSHAARKGAYGIRTRAAAVRARCPRPLDECAGRFSVATPGNNRPMLGPWRKRREEHRASKQEGDPRGGVQSDEYRTADPRELVEDGGTVMAAPGGLRKKRRRRRNRARKIEAEHGYNAGGPAGSSNGRTPDSGSGSRGSSPCPAATKRLERAPKGETDHAQTGTRRVSGSHAGRAHALSREGRQLRDEGRPKGGARRA